MGLQALSSCQGRTAGGCWAQYEGPFHLRRARLGIWELPALRVLEVAGVVRAESLWSDKHLREGWGEGWVEEQVVRCPTGLGLLGRHLPMR